MKLALLIIRKFLSSSKDKKYISKLSFFSYILVSLGVAVPILVLSVTNGFQIQVEKRLLQYDFHGQIFFPSFLSKKEIRTAENASVYGFYEDKCLLRSRQTSKVTQVRAFFEKDLTAPFFQTYKLLAGERLPKTGGIVLAENLAYSLRVGIGDQISIIAVDHSIGYSNFTEKHLRVDGILSLGYAAYDVTASFINKEDADQIFLTEPDAFNKLGFLANPNFSRNEIREKFQKFQQGYPSGIPHLTFDNKVFKDFQVEKKSLTLAMFVIIFIAFLAIFITLNVVLADKLVDVGLLKTLGINPGTMIKIFLGQGAWIAFMGITFGFLAGSWITVNLDVLISAFEFLVNQVLALSNLMGITHFPPFYRYQIMPEETYYISSLPYELRLQDFIIQGIGAFVLSVAAALSPALKVIKTNPARILRNE